MRKGAGSHSIAAVLQLSRSQALTTMAIACRALVQWQIVRFLFVLQKQQLEQQLGQTTISQGSNGETKLWSAPNYSLSQKENMMPKATTCTLNKMIITVEAALHLRDEAKRAGQTSPDFRCVDCGKAVRPHRDGGSGAAHFEHLERNPTCPLSNRLGG